MDQNPSRPIESSHIAQELLANGPDQATRRCIIVQQILAEGRIPLERLLAMYELSTEEYHHFENGPNPKDT